MTGILQPLDNKFAIVDPHGNPTDYFIRWAQQKQIDIESSITLTDLANYLAAHKLASGQGIALTPDGNLADSPSISILNGTGLDFDVMHNLKLADTAVVPGTYGDATHVPALVVDQQGRITGVTLVAITGGGGALTQIASQTLAAAAASFSFTGIANTYSDLIVVLTGRGDKAAAFVEARLRFNNDSGANYDFESNLMNNATVTSGGTAGSTFVFAGWLPAASGVASASSSCEITVPNYAETTFHKDLRSRGGLRTGAAAANLFSADIWGDWRSTAAINRIDLFPDSGNFVIGTKATLYGRA